MADDFWELEESTDLVEQEESTDVIILEQGTGPTGDVTTPRERTMSISLNGNCCDTSSSFKNVVKEKTTSSTLDYKFDWKALTNGTGLQNWLEDNENITVAILAVPSGIVKDSAAITDSNTTVIIWLSGGAVSTQYDIPCYIETDKNRKELVTMIIRMVEKKSG